MNEFECLDRRDMQNRRRKRMFSQSEAPLDFCMNQRNFAPAAGPRKEQHQRRKRQSHADSEHGPGDFFGRRFPGTVAVIEDF